MAEVASTAWTRESLKVAGFVGWVTFETLMNNLGEVPQPGGVYIVIQPTSTEPDFVKSNPGGWFKGRTRPSGAGRARGARAQIAGAHRPPRHA